MGDFFFSFRLCVCVCVCVVSMFPQSLLGSPLGILGSGHALLKDFHHVLTHTPVAPIVVETVL